MKKNILMLIDPQVDFCEGGSLAVPGGLQAMTNVANLINRVGDYFSDIVVTLDSHHNLHIAHPLWFVNEQGEHPDPFTTVVERDGEIYGGTLDDQGTFHEKEKLRCRRLAFTEWTLHYLRSLAENKRYPHMIWEPHCLIGSPGACIVPDVLDAISKWERKYHGVATKVTKGSDIRVEHFGALKAEVQNPDNPETGINSVFLDALSDPDTTIYLAGLALSHCVANTARDTADQFDGDTFCQRTVLLEDGTASVAGLEFLGDNFVNDFKARGMRVQKTAEVDALQTASA